MSSPLGLQHILALTLNKHLGSIPTTTATIHSSTNPASFRSLLGSYRAVGHLHVRNVPAVQDDRARV